MTRMLKKFKSALKGRYWQDTSGHFAIWIALLATPLLGFTTLAIDHNNAERMRGDVKNALDAAAIASVSDQTLTMAEREAYALSHFAQNFDRAAEFKVTPDNRLADRISLTAVGASPVTVAATFGVKAIAIEEQSTAIVTRESIICVLTLNPDGRNSFELFKSSNFSAPNCAVQVNSTHAEAAVVDGSSSAMAQDFCVTGGAVGNFRPFANTQCSPVDDPYVNKTAPISGACIDMSDYKKGKGGNAVIGNSAVLSPGTYCDTLDVRGTGITFLPGNYIFENSELWMRQNSSVKADNVTLILKGGDSVIFVERGSSFYLKAPATGNLAGLAIFQDRASISDSPKFFPTGTTALTGESSMTIVGTVYVPTQTIEVWGGSQYNNTSPATSYIGYNVALGNNSGLAVNVDHKKAGLPPILPRSDEGARLVE